MARKKTERSADFETAKKAGLYVRVSTRYQIDKDSLPFQRKKLKEYCKLMGIDAFRIFGKKYRSAAFSRYDEPRQGRRIFTYHRLEG